MAIKMQVSDRYAPKVQVQYPGSEEVMTACMQMPKFGKLNSTMGDAGDT